MRDARIFGRRSVASDSAGVWVCNVRWRRAEHPRPAPPTHRPVSEFWAVASPAVLRAWAAGRGMRGVRGVRICEYANMRGARLFHAYLSAPYLPPRNLRAVYITQVGAAWRVGGRRQLPLRRLLATGYARSVAEPLYKYTIHLP